MTNKFLHPILQSLFRHSMRRQMQAKMDVVATTVQICPQYSAERKAAVDEYRALLEKASPEDAKEAESRRMQRAAGIRSACGGFKFSEHAGGDVFKREAEWIRAHPYISPEEMGPSDLRVFIDFLHNPAGVRAREAKCDAEVKAMLDAMIQSQEKREREMAPFRAGHPPDVVKFLRTRAGWEGFSEQKVYELPKAEFDAFFKQKRDAHRAKYDAYCFRVAKANAKRAVLNKKPIKLKPDDYGLPDDVFTDSDDDLW